MVDESKASSNHSTVSLEESIIPSYPSPALSSKEVEHKLELKKTIGSKEFFIFLFWDNT